MIIEKLTTHTRERIGNRWNVEDNIKKLQHTLAKVQSILEDAEEQQASNSAVRVWLSKFREVAFSAEDLLLFLPRGPANTARAFMTMIVRPKLADEVIEMLHALQMASDEGLRLNLRERVAVHNKFFRCGS